MILILSFVIFLYFPQFKNEHVFISIRKTAINVILKVKKNKISMSCKEYLNLNKIR